MSVEDFSDVVRAIASLAWPLIALTALLLFRGEISNLLKRVRRGKAAGIEFELADELAELQQRTQAVGETLPDWPAEPSLGVEGAADTAAEADEILDRAAAQPTAALMTVAAAIERRSREVLSTRYPEEARGTSLARQLQLLDLSPRLKEAADEFRRVRNRIVHGGVATDDEVLRAVDIGLSILSAIDRIPHELNRVVVPKVDCFADAQGTQRHDFQAVLLSAQRGDDDQPEERAFPHTGGQLPGGEPVSWEWKRGRVFPETWYRDPRDGEIKYGWTESLEFAGQPLHPQ